MPFPNWHEVTALFGGRFDPPHLGHREAVRGLFSCPGIKSVWVLPSATPPHKSAVASMEHRRRMAQLNFTSTLQDPFPVEVRIDDRELRRAQANPQRPSYSWDTLQELRSELPQMAFVIGADQLEEFHTWYRFPEILGLCHWIVLERQPHGNQQAHRTLQEWKSSGLIRATPKDSLWTISGQTTFMTVVPTSAPSASSTVIRETLVRSGKPPVGALLPEVEGYLNEKQLYGIF